MAAAADQTTVNGTSKSPRKDSNTLAVLEHSCSPHGEPMCVRSSTDASTTMTALRNSTHANQTFLFTYMWLSTVCIANTARRKCAVKKKA